MRRVSEIFKNEWKKQNRTLKYYADLTLKDGTVLQISDEDLVQPGGFKIVERLAGRGRLELYPVMTGKLTLLLKNRQDKFSGYDFQGAKVSAYAGLVTAGSAVEKIRMGTYRVENAASKEDTVTLECPDNICLFRRPYGESKLAYPATLYKIVEDACQVCGVTAAPEALEKMDNGGYNAGQRPFDTALTFLDVLAWAAQISGSYVKCDEDGRLSFRWYEERGRQREYVLADEREEKILTDESQGIVIFSEVLPERVLKDGGIFDGDKPYHSGDPLDGKTFEPWEDQVRYDAGTFDSMESYHHITAPGALTVSTENIEVTGVRVVTEDMYGNRSEYLSGKEGYVFEVVKNGLIQTKDQAKAVSVDLAEKMKGLTFRPFEVTHGADPVIEAGDQAYVTDEKENTYKAFLTDITFVSGEAQKSSCRAESILKKEGAHFSRTDKAASESKKAALDQIRHYDVSVQALTDLMVQVFGMFKTQEMAEDGSITFYLRKKQQPANSNVVWKMGKEGFFVSTDGGTSWKSGTDDSGNVAEDVLSMFGVYPDGIRTEKVMADGSDGTNLTFDKNGTIQMNTSTFQMGASTGKSGWARFSDGSYLEFKNGVLVGGKTANGTNM